MTDRPQTGADVSPMAGAYRAVWRWHFYAGLLVLPLLWLMTLTGGLYLFKDCIDAAVYRPLAHVEGRAGSSSPHQWVSTAEARTGGIVSNVLVPAREDQAVRLTVDLGKGAEARPSSIRTTDGCSG
ncbi:PepSY domain-containing protein [Brevundimonas diminuta]